MKFEQIIQSIELGKFAPVYLLHGEESYYLDRIVHLLEEHALKPEEKAFNFHMLYGKDSEPEQVLDYARRFPVMAERQLILLKEAQEWAGKLQELAEYCKKPIPSTILVIVHPHKKPDKRTSLYQAVKKNGIVFESKKPYQDKVPAWIDGYVRSKGTTIDPGAAQIVAEYLGTDLQKIANELDKIRLNLPEGAAIAPEHIESGIGISREYNIFELQKAIGWKERARAFRIMESMRANMKQNPMPMVTASLFSYFRKIYLIKASGRMARAQQASLIGLRNQYFLNEYIKAASLYSLTELETVISTIREFDLRSKGVGSTSHIPAEELFREMVFRIMGN